jgi:hypothetical protein
VVCDPAQGGAWQKVAVDDSAPSRSFLDPGVFKKCEKVERVAVARGLDGSVSVSPVVTFIPQS